MIYYIGAGSNLGDRSGFLLNALARLKQEAKVLSLAPLLENPPLLPESAPESWYRPFLNTVFKMNWSESPESLLALLKQIERESGRESVHERWAPRSLDLDILCSENGAGINTPQLKLPHESVLDRSFTLQPLAHLNAQLRIHQTSVLEALRKSPHTSPYLMGVLNCTPDSFSNSSLDTAAFHNGLIEKFKTLLDSNVAVIDLGAESTRPGACAVSSELEIERLRAVLDYWVSVRMEYPWTSLSIDTRHATTARFALEHGVKILNDVSHLSDPEMKSVASGFDQIVFMHSLTVPADKNIALSEQAPVTEQLVHWCENKLEDFKELPLEKLIFDPGIGFNKTPVQSLRILQNLDQFNKLPVRLLIGHSRKSFMNLWTKSDFSERDEETLGVSLALINNSIQILRVHNVEMHQRALLSYQCLRTPL